jgi:hypothetical protein
MTRSMGSLPMSSVGRALLPDLLLSFLFSAIFSIWMLIAIGRNLGLFFAGLILSTLLAPILSTKNPLHCIPIIVAISLIWLSCIFNDAITPSEWLRATLVLLIYTLALSSLSILLSKFHIPPALIVILSLAWLSWPIWLAPALHGESSAPTVARLVAGNPTFAIQAALSSSFPVPWAQHRIAYRLTNIGDDIPYSMPTSILRCIIYHGIIAAIALLAARLAARPARPPDDQSPKST